MASLERRISASILRLRVREPFFATLALYARFIADETLPTAATDGVDVRYNPGYLGKLTDRELDAVLTHEVLHAALLHVPRRGERDAVRWNIAADIVVNGVVSKQDWMTLPKGAILEPKLEDRRVEEIYELLQQHTGHRCPGCLQPRGAPGEAGWAQRLAELEAHWRQALRQAEAVSRAHHQGQLPSGFARLVEAAQPSLNWRALLWRYLVRTPHDYTGFDRRFVHLGWYLDALEGDSVEVFIGIDTSGSISDVQLSSFLGEVRGILGSYPHLSAMLYYADAALHGPYPLARGDAPPRPVGGGGTSFVPFFDAVQKDARPDSVCVYLTDGFGTFPSREPQHSVLWVVTPGGLRPERFPFGEVCSLLSM